MMPSMRKIARQKHIIEKVVYKINKHESKKGPFRQRVHNRP